LGRLEKYAKRNIGEKMKRYVIVKGGIGNQMFQYAFYRSLVNQGLDVCLDTTMFQDLQMHNGFELPSIFGICDKCICRPCFIQRCIDVVNKLCPKALTTRDNGTKVDKKNLKLLLNGYWQSETYFDLAKEDIIKAFTFQNIDQINLARAQDMQKRNSVSIHIRRGDYIGLEHYANICTEDYYRKAITYIKQHVNTPLFYIFSNDTEWSKKFADELGIKYIIITHNTGADSYKDMYLLTQCHHNILANSSFSWWGAYLNQHENCIRIAPKQWDHQDTKEYNDIRIPNNWIRL
jgi:hypothetical protein